MSVTGEKKRAASDLKKNASPSLVSSASSKKSKGVTLFDTSTSDSLAALAAMQKKLAHAKLEQIRNENATKKLNEEEIDLKLRMQKFQMLHDIREKNPTLTKEQIIAMFPTLAEFVNILDK